MPKESLAPQPHALSSTCAAGLMSAALCRAPPAPNKPPAQHAGSLKAAEVDGVLGVRCACQEPPGFAQHSLATGKRREGAEGKFSPSSTYVDFSGASRKKN